MNLRKDKDAEGWLSVGGSSEFSTPHRRNGPMGKGTKLTKKKLIHIAASQPDIQQHKQIRSLSLSLSL